MRTGSGRAGARRTDGALDASRRLALEYARARTALDGHPDRASLEALTSLVVDRELADGDHDSAQAALDAIWEKVEAGERLDADDGLTLMESDDVLQLGELADTLDAGAAARTASTSSRTSIWTRRTSAA